MDLVGHPQEWTGTGGKTTIPLLPSAGDLTVVVIGCASADGRLGAARLITRSKHHGSFGEREFQLPQRAGCSGIAMTVPAESS